MSVLHVCIRHRSILQHNNDCFRKTQCCNIGSIKTKIAEGYGGLHGYSAWGDPLPKRNQERQSVACARFGTPEVLLRTSTRWSGSCMYLSFSRRPALTGPRRPPKFSFYYAVLTAGGVERGLQLTVQKAKTIQPHLPLWSDAHRIANKQLWPLGEE